MALGVIRLKLIGRSLTSFRSTRHRTFVSLSPSLLRLFSRQTQPKMDVESLKLTAQKAIHDATEELYDVSQEIWNKPELCHEEHHAHQVLTDFLERKGFKVERKYLLDTAFRATYGNSDKPHISVLCEYDALPEIGHGCGHNLIAEVGIAAGLGIKAAMEQAGEPLGKLTVLGTPAEEGQGGKIDMINKDAFAGMDASLMAHPSSNSISSPLMSSMTGVYATFHGKASHAAAFPWEGVNALDAAVMLYNSVSCMRQQMKPTWRVHGVFTNGGTKPNIIPEVSQVYFYLRAPNEGEISILKEKFENCVNAAATATGCKAEIEWEISYKNLITNETILSLYEKNCKAQGVIFPSVLRQGGSTDMGNVSHEIPAIHPKFGIGTQAAQHSKEFTRVAGLKDAQGSTLTTAKALAMTALDLYCRPDLLGKAKEELSATVKN